MTKKYEGDIDEYPVRKSFSARFAADRRSCFSMIPALAEGVSCTAIRKNG